MKENIADNILARMNKTVGNVAKRLATQYQGVKPFDKEPMKSEDQLFWYEQLGMQDMAYLVQKYGREALNEYVFNMEQIKSRRSKNVKPTGV